MRAVPDFAVFHPGYKRQRIAYSAAARAGFACTETR
jgi:hypothetical protein